MKVKDEWDAFTKYTAWKLLLPLQSVDQRKYSFWMCAVLMHDIEIFEQVICHDNSFNSIINVNYNLMHTIIKPTQEFSPFPPSQHCTGGSFTWKKKCKHEKFQIREYWNVYKTRKNVNQLIHFPIAKLLILKTHMPCRRECRLFSSYQINHKQIIDRKKICGGKETNIFGSEFLFLSLFFSCFHCY